MISDKVKQETYGQNVIDSGLRVACHFINQYVPFYVKAGDPTYWHKMSSMQSCSTMQL